MRLWFRKSETTDREILTGFGTMVQKALDGEYAHWHDVPQGRLAKIILLDQLTRNMFRGTPKAFSGDTEALELALSAIESGMDEAVAPNQRLFFYLPLEHDETLANQERCMALTAALAKTIPSEARKAYEGFYDYAVRHRDVIARFGRFPHRNAILGRDSSQEEIEFLKQPGSSF